MNKIQVMYDELERIARQIDRLQEVADMHRARVYEWRSWMESGVWIGRGSEAFTEELVYLVEPATRRLSAALEATALKLREAIIRYQEAEREGAALFNRDLTGVTFSVGKAIADKALASLYPTPDSGLRESYGGLYNDVRRPPWLTEYSEADGGLTGATKADVLFINGIQTDPQSHISGLIQVSEAYGNVPVTGIYNKTAGDGLGALLDVRQSLNDWAESHFGFRFDWVNPAVDQAVKWIKEHPDGQLVVHSQGAAITSAALMRLARENPPFDLDNLKVTTLGGAGAKFPDGPDYRHLSFTGDHIPGATLKFNNPTMLNMHIFHPDYTTISYAAEGNNFVESVMNTHSMTGYLRNLDTFEKVEAIEMQVFGCVDPSSVYFKNMEWEKLKLYVKQIDEHIKVVQ